MSLLVIAGFFFVPILSLVGVQYYGARALNFSVPRKPYVTGLILGFIAVVVGVNYMIDSWAGLNKPVLNMHVLTVLLLPSIVSLLGVLGVSYLLKLAFSRKAYLGGWISGVVGSVITVFLFYGYFTG